MNAAERVPTDVTELEAFLDQAVPNAMQQWHVPGAVILLVNNDSVVLQKGYGYADLDKQVPMAPATTVLRVFSLSKLFTATAIMQLAEQGRIDLDADVNTYLRQIRVQETKGQPITIRHLLTHTAGFDSDQRAVGGSATSTADWLPLDRYLAKRGLAAMWPAGKQFLYTNAAYDVLGLVVEDVSGQSFAEYMSQRILSPLGMARSTFLQPPPPGSEVAVTYRYSMGQQTIVPYGLMLDAPAAGLTSTATDIAHFMISHLDGGRYGDVRILQDSTVREMHRQQFSYDPNQPGMTLGFRQAFSARTRNGFRETSPTPDAVLWHEGGGPTAPTSYMQLRPDQGFGLFIAYNSDEPAFLDQVLRDFDDHYDPLPPAPTQTRSSDHVEDLSRFTGTYRATDYSRSTVSKLLLLQDEDLPRVVTSANSIGIRWLADGPDPPEPLVHVEPLVFASQDGRFRFTFLQDESDAISGMVWGNLFVLEKVPWYETVGFQRSLFAVFLLGFATAALVWPLSALLARLVRRNGNRLMGRANTGVARLAGGAASINAALNALFLLGLLIILPRAFDLGLQFGMPPLLAALFALPMLTTAFAIGLVALAVPVMRNRGWPSVARWGYCLYSVFAIAFVPFLLYWNLLGLRW